MLQACRRALGAPRAFCVVVAMAATLMSAAPAFAASIQGPKRSALKLLEDGDAVRKRLLLREGRFSIAPVIGFTLNDAFQRTALLGAGLRYNLSDTVALGGSFLHGISFDSALAEEITLKRKEKVAQAGFSSVAQVISAELVYTPLFGKLALFGRLAFNYDIQAIVGGGVTVLDGERDLSSTAPMLIVGAGLRVFIENNIGVNLQIRDHVYSAALNAVVPITEDVGSDAVAEAEFSNNFAMMVGVEFIFPQEPETSD
jgi:outer membrane beta-barrel protein